MLPGALPAALRIERQARLPRSVAMKFMRLHRIKCGVLVLCATAVLFLELSDTVVFQEEQYMLVGSDLTVTTSTENGDMRVTQKNLRVGNDGDVFSVEAFGRMELRKSFYSQLDSSDLVSSRERNRVLIAQYDYGNFNNSYAEIIGLTSKVNKAYARKHGHDYILARGVYIDVVSGQKSSQVSGKVAAGSTSNKVGILQYALTHPDQTWDYVLIMDSDAMLYDFSRDIGGIYRMNEDSIIAHRVRNWMRERTWNINAGVTLWNLRGPETEVLVKEWELTIRQVFQKRVGEDQDALHKVLWRRPHKHRPVRAIRSDFQYSKGTVVKHFIRPGSKWLRGSWDDTLLDTNTRIQQIRDHVTEICTRYPFECNEVESEVG